MTLSFIQLKSGSSLGSVLSLSSGTRPFPSRQWRDCDSCWSSVVRPAELGGMAQSWHWSPKVIPSVWTGLWPSSLSGFFYPDSPGVNELWLCLPRGHSAIQGTVTSCKDTDVEKEQMRVLKGRTSGDILVLYNLSKSYRSFFKRTTAVQDISVGIKRGEVRSA